ncbi:hypothetical protein [Streptomyces sp. NBC_00198]|uniref:hypothetical protein n=1 Tax=Streptomyces sp. NBC_00198 TaxID=2975677 RepID=UPI00225349C3|nr:hypothetical protein [Streptomyces sp. NBC_00198]MCX5284118.1 hypothetical protein [Streptomyces sp. NBC_00198]
MTQQPTDQSLALQFARQWSKLPAAHLKAALTFLTPQMEREHAERMLAERLRHRREMTGLYAGIAISLIAFGGCIFFGIRENFWAAGILSGPTLASTLTIFVLKKAPEPKVAEATLSTLRMLSNSQSVAPAPPQQSGSPMV